MAGSNRLVNKLFIFFLSLFILMSLSILIMVALVWRIGYDNIVIDTPEELRRIQKIIAQSASSTVAHSDNDKTGKLDKDVKLITGFSEESLRNTETIEWSVYNNDAIGISFKYPKSWGEPTTRPNQAIEYLDVINKSFSENNSSRYMIELDFNKKNIILRFFNKEFPGALDNPEHFINNWTIESYKDIVSNSDICLAQAAAIYTRDELLASGCTKNLKREVTFNSTAKPEASGEYHYKLFTYRQLHNGFFDHLIVSAQGSRDASNIDHNVFVSDFIAGSPSVMDFIHLDEQFTQMLDSMQIYP